MRWIGNNNDSSFDWVVASIVLSEGETVGTFFTKILWTRVPFRHSPPPSSSTTVLHMTNREAGTIISDKK